MTGFRDADNDTVMSDFPDRDEMQRRLTRICDEARAHRLASREQSYPAEAPETLREQSLIAINASLTCLMDDLTKQVAQLRQDYINLMRENRELACENARLRRLVEFRAAAHAPPGPAAALRRALRGGDGIPR